MQLVIGHGMVVRTSECDGRPTDQPAVVVGGGHYELCLVRRGCFYVRGPAHSGVLADTQTCVMGEPNHVVEVTHPGVGGDADTFVQLDEPLLGSIFGQSAGVPPIAHVTPRMALLHLQLLSASRSGLDAVAVEELALELFTSAIEQSEPARVDTGRPADRRRQRLVDDARAVLASDLDLSVVELARVVGCSPHHLSRTFVRHTGRGVARHRLALRVHRALDALAAGETRLARLAADCGFADHSHLVRAVKTILGMTPTQIRAALEPALDDPQPTQKPRASRHLRNRSESWWPGLGE